MDAIRPSPATGTAKSPKRPCASAGAPATMSPMDLPDGLTARPLRMSDARAMYELFAASEQADTGEVAIEPEDIEGDWQRPSFDLEQESVGVFDGPTLVAAAEVYKTRRAEATVHPDHRGRGIGTWLAAWVEDCSRRRGGTLVGQTVPLGSSAERLFTTLGYREGWTSWVLVVPEGAAIEPQPLPHGYLLRDLVPGADEQVAHLLVEDAFNEWPDRQPSAFDDWAARTVRRPGLRALADQVRRRPRRHTGRRRLHDRHRGVRLRRPAGGARRPARQGPRPGAARRRVRARPRARRHP